MLNDNKDITSHSNSEISAGQNHYQSPENNKDSKFKLSAANNQLKKNITKRITEGRMQQSVKDQSFSSQLITSQNIQMRSHIQKKNNEDESKNLPTTEMNNNDNNEVKRKGIFEEYQERWEKNNKKIFRYLITWKVGDDGKIEDQLKLMITYLSIIFIFILVICGFATTYYFHQTNKQNIKYSIENQAQTILQNGLSQYQNSTEYIFKGYEFVLNYLNDIILSKLEISYKIYDFNQIRQFPYKGPKRMHQKGDTNTSMCDIYTGPVQFDINPVSLKCIDWYNFQPNTVPTVNEFVYQNVISSDTLVQAIDILNYILESQLFDVFVTKIYKIYFGFEARQQMFIYPGLLLNYIESNFTMIERPWYNVTKQYHLNQADNSTYRVISTPYYDAVSGDRVVTISKAILAPSPSDPTKRYLQGKGLFMGVANVDIKLSQFQELFQDITFYETGYLAIVSNEGQLLNEPAQFIIQIQMQGKVYESLSITQLIKQDVWNSIKTSKEQVLQQTTSIQGLDIVIASSVNSDNFYQGQSIVIMFIIPSSEVYGAIDSQNSENLKRILLSSLISFGGFLIATIICTIYVKKKIIQMVSAITELNQSALKLSGQNSDSSTNSKKEVMQKLNEIQQKAESETIKELVKGFENQLKGISKLGKGGQNILKNGKNVLKYESAEYCGTNLAQYIDPLLNYLDSKKEKMETDSINYQHTNPLCVNQIPVKTLQSHINQTQLKKKESEMAPIFSDNPNDTNGELLNFMSAANQTIGSPLSDISGVSKSNLFKSKLYKSNNIGKPLSLRQNEKLAGESQHGNEILNCSDINIDENSRDDVHQ
ncbi:cache domain protein (macronuclear) [Tetrahymena thermophila SB210]|uniref:Cache domain protein n=1 Tax=Tetrahymena thermophila (strain SB210) TaxID=312017 RepID=Q22NQ9_TETTS|nr:cache domain protein [Tetrahymena thermophila SB210]EAR86726.1 cache domain protein [Tetrahymena thermophila SB210]|eukprot:XP_001006971.1 cache domain protein [Tetrahymena thermophila SB210]